MLVLLNTDPYIDGREAMHEYLESVVREVLGQYGARIIRVAAYLTDANGAAKAGLGDVHCTLEAQLVGHEPVVARHHALTSSQAIHGALRKLGCCCAEPVFSTRQPGPEDADKPL